MTVRNRARCRLCDTVVESMHRHDFQTCNCGALSVDGGQNYRRRVWGRDDVSVADGVEELPG